MIKFIKKHIHSFFDNKPKYFTWEAFDENEIDSFMSLDKNKINEICSSVKKNNAPEKNPLNKGENLQYVKDAEELEYLLYKILKKENLEHEKENYSYFYFLSELDIYPNQLSLNCSLSTEDIGNIIYTVVRIYSDKEKKGYYVIQ